MIYLMDLPMPIHGMSSVNLTILNKAFNVGLDPRVINTVPSYAARFFNTRLWLVFKFFHTLYCYGAMFTLSFLNIRGIVYRPINGGVGQVYDLVYMVLCRIFLNKVYIHHHSFNYLNDKSALFYVLNRVAGRSAVHVVLGERMGRLLNQLYDIEHSNIKVVSNLSLFDSKDITKSTEDRQLVVLGHLANLCIEKGVSVFIEVCYALKAMNIKFEAKIAGPFADESARNAVLVATKNLPEIEYLGPLYGKQKEVFYGTIDCFVFPSIYLNEAEPLVLYEAAQYGVLNIGTQRGCMQDVIRKLQGYSFPEGESLVNNIAASICEAIDIGTLNEVEREGRVEEFKLMQSQAKESLNNLITKMGERNRDVSKT